MCTEVVVEERYRYRKHNEIRQQKQQHEDVPVKSTQYIQLQQMTARP